MIPVYSPLTNSIITYAKTSATNWYIDMDIHGLRLRPRIGNIATVVPAAKVHSGTQDLKETVTQTWSHKELHELYTQSTIAKKFAMVSNYNL